jgi:hypothetical protein
MVKWRYSSTALDQGTWWKCVVSPHYPLYRRLGRPQSRYGRCGALPRIKHRFFGSTICSVVAIPTELSRLHAEGFIHQIKLFSRRLNVMTPSRGISLVNIGWISNFLEAVSHEIWLIAQDDLFHYKWISFYHGLCQRYILWPLDWSFESSAILLKCWIWGSHGKGYEDRRLLGCDIM